MKKISKFLLYLSFIAYAVLILIAIYDAYNGYKIYTWLFSNYIKTVYGFDAFKESILNNGLLIIPICFIYQVIYLIIHNILKLKKRKEK